MNGAIMTSSVILAGVYANIREKLHIDSKSTSWKIFSMIRTAIIVFIGRYITRSPSVSVSLKLLGKTFSPFAFNIQELFGGALTSLGLTSSDYIIIAAACLVMLAVEYLCEYKGLNSNTLDNKNILIQWLPLVAIILAILLLGIMRGSYISSEFIYKQY